MLPARLACTHAQAQLALILVFIFRREVEDGPIGIAIEGDHRTGDPAHETVHDRAHQGPFIAPGRCAQSEPDDQLLLADRSPDGRLQILEQVAKSLRFIEEFGGSVQKLIG